jgi:hypothetical protein
MEGSVALIADSDFTFSLAEEDVPDIVLSGNGFVYAPVSQGESAGYAYICINGNQVGKVPLVFGKTVEWEADKPLTLWERLFGGR